MESVPGDADAGADPEEFCLKLQLDMQEMCFGVNGHPRYQICGRLSPQAAKAHRSARPLARLRLRPTSHAAPHKLDTLSPSAPIRAELVVCDLSASPHVDLARMLHQLQDELAARGIALLVGLIGCKLWMTYWVGPLRAVCKPEASGARALLR